MSATYAAPETSDFTYDNAVDFEPMPKHTLVLMGDPEQTRSLNNKLAGDDGCTTKCHRMFIKQMVKWQRDVADSMPVVALVVKAHIRMDHTLDKAVSGILQFLDHLDIVGIIVTQTDEVEWKSENLCQKLEQETGESIMCLSESLGAEELVSHFHRKCRVENLPLRIEQSTLGPSSFKKQKMTKDGVLALRRGKDAVLQILSSVPEQLQEDLLCEYLHHAREEISDAGNRLQESNGFSTAFGPRHKQMEHRGRVANLTEQMQHEVEGMRQRLHALRLSKGNGGSSATQMRKCPYCGLAQQNMHGQHGWMGCGQQCPPPSFRRGEFANFRFRDHAGQFVIKFAGQNKCSVKGCGQTVFWNDMSSARTILLVGDRNRTSVLHRKLSPAAKTKGLQIVDCATLRSDEVLLSMILLVAQADDKFSVNSLLWDWGEHMNKSALALVNTQRVCRPREELRQNFLDHIQKFTTWRDRPCIDDGMEADEMLSALVSAFPGEEEQVRVKEMRSLCMQEMRGSGKQRARSAYSYGASRERESDRGSLGGSHQRESDRGTQQNQTRRMVLPQPLCSSMREPPHPQPFPRIAGSRMYFYHEWPRDDKRLMCGLSVLDALSPLR